MVRWKVWGFERHLRKPDRSGPRTRPIAEALAAARTRPGAQRVHNRRRGEEQRRE